MPEPSAARIGREHEDEPMRSSGPLRELEDRPYPSAAQDRREWREYRVEVTCERCGADLFMRFDARAEGEPTAEAMAAHYVSQVRLVCPYCDCRVTPQRFDPDFVAVTPEVVSFAGVCDHDWRADPEGYVYLSNPPSRRIMCAKCGAKSFQMAPMPEPVSRDPHDWPKADA